MAEEIFPYAIEETVKRMGSFVVEGISLVWGFKGKLEKLKESLNTIEAVIQDAERRQVEGPIRRWLEKLQDIARDADDVLDELAYETLRQKVENQNNYLMGKVCSFFSLSNPIAFRLNMALKIENINESLDELNREASRCGINRVSPADRTPPQLSLNRETDSFLDNSKIVIGRKDDVSKIVNLLSSSSSDQQTLAVIPIVGLGGLGKTTLAKLVIEAVKERRLFDETFWVCVSDDFNDRKILGGMLEKLDKNTGGLNNIDAILSHLKNQLERKTFFLVLDDVWNEDCRKWDSLKSRLLEINGIERSAVLVTTRSKKVATIMETSPDCRHEVKQLSDDEIWSIIRNIVSRNGRDPVSLELEAIGKGIARKCGGVPLVASVLGGLLLSNKEEQNWLSIRNSDAFEALKNNDEVLPILKLSFDFLSSSSLKSCFAYCSIFPKDFVFDKEQLIQLWMAEGLFRSSHERMNDALEDIGDKHFNNLLDRFFFQDVRRDEFQNIIDCKMHDLVHDLALLVSKSETLTLEAGSTIASTSHVLHLNLNGHGEMDEPSFINARKLHTLFSRIDVLKSWKFKSLRTLNLYAACVKKLPASISKLKHLRYLDVSYTFIRVFPQSITRLYHLQTLIANECKSLYELPKKMRNLVSLRHFYFPRIVQMPAYVGCLTSLQTWQPGVLFVVGRKRGHKIEELGCFKELSSEWRIVNLEHVRDKEEAERANLFGKEKISRLELEWGCGRECSNCNRNDEEVLEGLQAPLGIRSLTIENYLGENFPQWLLMPRLSNLVELKLKGCSMFKQLPSLGHLRCLEILEVDGNGMEGVSCIGKEFYGGNAIPFPALKRFSLRNIRSLVEWMAPDAAAVGGVHGVALFPCLKELYIEKCPKLKSIPSITNLSSELRKFEIDDCGSLSHLSGDFVASSFFESFKLCVYGSPASIPSIECGPVLERLEITTSSWLRCSLSLECVGRFSFDSKLWISTDQSLSYSLGNFFRCLTGLKRLDIGPFCSLWEEYPAEILNSIHHLSGPLEELKIYGWYGLRSPVIPHQFQHLTALNRLFIDYLNEVEALPDWLGNLSSLQLLKVYDCKNLKYLPSSTAMQRLSRLEELEIWSCPLLQENCRRGSGCEWPKISHIPTVNLHT